MTSIDWVGSWIPGGHCVIEGDSRLVLPLLAPGFGAAYLDPPYATGSNNLSYSDSLNQTEWCGLFETVAAATIRLLDDTKSCPILVSIDDHRLIEARLILDRLLPGGFVATIVVQSSVRPGSRLVSVGHEYLLVYVTHPGWLRRDRVKWRMPKPSVELVLNQAQRVWDTHKPNLEAASMGMRAWYTGQQDDAGVWGCREYKWFTPEGRLFRRGPLGAPRGSRHYYYDLVSPTGDKYEPSEWGWRMPETTWRHWLATGQIDWGQNPGLIPARCLFLDEHQHQVPGSVEVFSRSASTRNLTGHGAGFSFPKNPALLAKWLNITTGGDTTLRVLDPFAGSAVTIQALEILNNNDGGVRNATCVQIRETMKHQAGTIFETVTLPCARESASKRVGLNVGYHTTPHTVTSVPPTGEGVRARMPQ